MIGYFGVVIFSVSDQKILSFHDFKLNASGSWGEHKRNGKKSEYEFLGPSVRTVSFVIELDASYGVNPGDMLDILAGYAENGLVSPLVIGNKKIGDRWRLTKVSSSWNQIMNDGKLMKASASVTLEEYL
nr:MAG TPA: hypothetical protein [Caudoviricetes sp.]